MRIVSMLPAATDMVAELGLPAPLVGQSTVADRGEPTQPGPHTPP
ncbi:hypothetical protein AB0M42_20960 [Streptomyces sp. NPDC051784]